MINIPKQLDDDINNIPIYRNSNKQVNISQLLKNNELSSKNNQINLLDDTLDCMMYDKLLDNIKNKPKDVNQSVNPILNSGNNIVNNNSNNFTTSLIQRLNNLENNYKILQNELIDKNNYIKRLELDNQILLDKFNNIDNDITNPNNNDNQIKSLKDQLDNANNQIKDMIEFLDDYGLVWVGYNDDNKTIESNDNNEYFVDNNLLIKRLNELNDVINNEPTQIHIDSYNKKGRLVNPSETTKKLKITIYCNGLMINRGPFRSNNNESYKSFVNDVIDGYFPSEFKTIYPHGILFDIIDKQNDSYNENDHNKLSKDQLINNLPKSVIKNGEIYSVRSDVSSMLTKVNDISDNIIITPAYNDINQTSASIVTINMKWIDSKQYRIKMYETDIIKDLKEYIIKHFQSLNIEMPFFELKSVYPRKILIDQLSLFEAGLVPNGTVHASKC